MSKKKIKNSFLLQGSILAVAGLLVRVIGLIYRVPLTNILGEKGMGCYGTAYDVYNILILLSSQSMPIAVSKLVSEKLGRNEEAYHLLNDGDGIDVSDIREGDSDIQAIWESLHEKLYGEKGHLPHYYNFKVN